MILPLAELAIPHSLACCQAFLAPRCELLKLSRNLLEGS
jgi:hypothetical protein